MTEISINEVIELTGKLVSFPSMTGTKAVTECAEYIKDWLIDVGISADIITYNGVPNVVARMGNKSGKKLLLDGHFDVVPPGDLKEWNTNPFEAVNQDGYLYGRGVSDMKSGVTAILLAMKALKEKEISLNGEITFFGVGDEETVSVNGTISLLNLYDKQFDSAIVTEPTDFCIESAQRGLRWIEFHVKGKACHAGRPHIGKNAIEMAAKIICELKKMKYEVHNELFEEGLKEPSLSVNRIIGGNGSNNVVAEDCTFLIDRRMLPGETVEEITEQIKKVADKEIQDGFSYDMHLVNDGWDPFVTDQNEPVLLELISSCKQVTGKEITVRGKGGCTDASHISNA